MLQLPDAPPGLFHDDHEALMDIAGDGLGLPAFSAYSYPGDVSMLDHSFSANYIQEFTTYWQ